MAIILGALLYLAIGLVLTYVAARFMDLDEDFYGAMIVWPIVIIVLLFIWLHNLGRQHSE